jgi:hypothetical protein
MVRDNNPKKHCCFSVMIMNDPCKHTILFAAKDSTRLAEVNMESASLISNESTPSGSTQQDMLIDAKQFYQHDPLFMLLKERWHLHDGWILLGGSILPTIAYSVWRIWLSFAPPLPSLRHFWTLNNTISALLQVFLIYPIMLLIYLHLPDWLANVFNQLHTNQVIGSRRINFEFLKILLSLYHLYRCDTFFVRPS